jgi:formylglycine-generating enzyme required for sulfatase activity
MKRKHEVRRISNRARQSQIGLKKFTNRIGMLMIPIPAGTFQMGSLPRAADSSSDDDERPQHKVTFRRPFYMAAHKVTQAQFASVLGRRPSWFSATGDGKENVAGIDTEHEGFPVECVSPYDAVDFCIELSRQEGLRPCYEMWGHERAHGKDSEGAVVKVLPDGTGYRLPSESEWEYCARAGSPAGPATRYWFGDDEGRLGEYAWFRGNSEDRTHPVGRKKANPWELFDMGGLLSEWCEDDWHDNYRRAPKNGSAWRRLDSHGHHLPGRSWSASSLWIVRGGSWWQSAWFCRCAARFRFDAWCLSMVGFRVVLVSDGARPQR